MLPERLSSEATMTAISQERLGMAMDGILLSLLVVAWGRRLEPM